MLRRICAIGLVLTVILAAVPALAQEPPQQARLEGVSVSTATTQPSTQPVIVVTTTQAPPESLYQQLLNTQLGEIMQGKRALTWSDIRQPAFWFDTIKNLVVTILAFIPRFIGTMVFLFVFWLLYRAIRKMALSSMKKGEVDSSIRDLLGAMIKWAVMGFGIVIACNQLGIPIVAMLTGVSIIGLAVGFAAQETLANFIAGIVIFLDKPFKVGDWIEVDGTFGQVKRVTFRSTRILTLDGEYHVVPNTQMLSTKFSNHSTNPINRVNIPIGISYRSSIDKAREVLLGLTRNDDRLVQNPPPEVVVSSLGPSSVDLLLRFWIADESIERRIGYEYIERAKKALDAAGIEIPFPHLQLFIEQTPALAALARNGNAAPAQAVN
ncbi:mechanosensitive ion channel family protein [Fontivita pretiosa]|uniref:mechanosensitive ion channel family protein n=1 Tax=Fontivita pretiosa TaxID=2989684 RepID=UPI003D17C1FF